MEQAATRTQNNDEIYAVWLMSDYTEGECRGAFCIGTFTSHYTV